MKLPKWNVLKTHYPALDAGTVFKDIGGKVELNYDIGVFSNACATRVSKALNGADGKLEAQVSSGKNRNWYIFRVKMLMKHLISKYGKPEKFSPSEYKTELKGRKGIIIFEVTGWSDATGHADL